MSGTEIAYLLVALAAVAIFLFLIRRAAEKQVSTRERLERTEEPTADISPPQPAPDEARRGPGKAKKKPSPEAKAPPEAPEAPEPEDLEPDQAAAAAERGPEAAGREDADRLKAGLAKTRGGFVARLGKLFSRKQIDRDILDELEQVLFTADIGPKTADRIFQSIKSSLSRDELSDPETVWAKIREASAEILDVEAQPLDFGRQHPFVLLIIGVNGAGKTTTIGKLAAKLRSQGKRVLLGAGDTFRAAAVEQLEIWGDRAGAPVVKGKPGGDPSSVLFESIKRASAEDYDVVICDTAGRLHTKIDLMEELKKVGRVCEKALPGSPHETWLVLDSTTGQNAIQQAQMFKEAMNITGIVLTKLDGTAKGGVILGICDELGVPVRYIGIGESIDDLREFDAKAFVDALYEHSETVEAA